MADITKLLLDIAKLKTPKEKIVGIDELSLLYNYERFLEEGKRVVNLSCGHKVLTKNRLNVSCPRCTEMLKRSIETGEEDYDGYRNHGVRDDMVWKEDPCRMLNERTDLGGNFISD